MVKQQISGVARRYARSAFALADEQGQLHILADESAALAKALQDSADFRAFVASPVLGIGAQHATLDALAARFGLSPVTHQLLGLLAKNRRLALLAEVCGALTELVRAANKTSLAEVTSAEPLSPAQKQALEEALKQVAGGTVLLETQVDRSLIGGVIVKLGSRMVDTSLKTKLAHMKIALKEVS